MSREVARMKPGAIALYGGSFDPIHSGHMAVAEEALRRFHLDRVIFVPSGIPPHKRRRHLALFSHRFAMIALACANNPRLTVSLAEAGPNEQGREVKYSVDTVQSFRRALRPRTKLYFIAGADQFLGISSWKQAEKLLSLCDFIVANRPGFDLEQLRSVLPPKALASKISKKGAGRSDGPKHIALRRTAVYPLESVAWDVSATEIRRRVRDHQSISGLVPQAVEDYIRKQGLYQ